MNFDSLLNHWQNTTLFDWARLGIVTSTGLTIFIAAAAVYVAYQQHVTNKRQIAFGPVRQMIGGLYTFARQS
jgi:hypothetical protein